MHVLTYSIMMLNTDLHSKQVKKKMTLEVCTVSYMCVIGRLPIPTIVCYLALNLPLCVLYMVWYLAMYIAGIHQESAKDEQWRKLPSRISQHCLQQNKVSIFKLDCVCLESVYMCACMHSSTCSIVYIQYIFHFKLCLFPSSSFPPPPSLPSLPLLLFSPSSLSLPSPSLPFSLPFSGKKRSSCQMNTVELLKRTISGRYVRVHSKNMLVLAPTMLVHVHIKPFC